MDISQEAKSVDLSIFSMNDVKLLEYLDNMIVEEDGHVYLYFNLKENIISNVDQHEKVKTQLAFVTDIVSRLQHFKHLTPRQVLTCINTMHAIIDNGEINNRLYKMKPSVESGYKKWYVYHIDRNALGNIIERIGKMESIHLGETTFSGKDVYKTVASRSRLNG